MMNNSPLPHSKISVVVPVLNEEDNVRYMMHRIEDALANWDFEVIFVDDGSVDNTVAIIKELQHEHAHLRCISHASSCGQSAAIRTGVQLANGTVIVTLDGDGQNPPHEIVNVVSRLLQLSGKVALVQGQREGRKDTVWKKFGSRFANFIRQKLLKDGVTDSGCGLKAFYKKAYLSLAYFDHLHRFMPAMMIREGYEIEVVEVSHKERNSGKSKYGNLDRAFVGIGDIFGVLWLKRRRKRSVFEEIISSRDDQKSDIIVLNQHSNNIS